jgi:hypothetical protein
MLLSVRVWLLAFRGSDKSDEAGWSFAAKAGEDHRPSVSVPVQ